MQGQCLWPACGPVHVPSRHSPRQAHGLAEQGHRVPASLGRVQGRGDSQQLDELLPCPTSRRASTTWSTACWRSRRWSASGSSFLGPCPSERHCEEVLHRMLTEGWQHSLRSMLLLNASRPQAAAAVPCSTLLQNSRLASSACQLGLIGGSEVKSENLVHLLRGGAFNRLLLGQPGARQYSALAGGETRYQAESASCQGRSCRTTTALPGPKAPKHGKRCTAAC